MRKGIPTLAPILAVLLALLTVAPATAISATVETSATTAFEGVASPKPAASGVDEQTALEDEVIRLTNLERMKHGLWPLRKSPTLTQVARGHNADMIKNNFVSHTGSNGFSSFERALAAGYTPYGWGKAYVGENIAAGLHTPAEALQGWLNSPPHRANLLRPEYREIGVGMAKGGPYGTYWTQNFGATPNSYPVYVNGGATSVSNPVVTLTITSETVSAWGSMGEATAMMVSEDPGFTGAKWQPYQAAVAWNLSPAAGTKTLHVRLRDAQGKTQDSTAQVALEPAVAKK